MMLERTLALALVGALGACSPAVEDEVLDDGSDTPDCDDTGDTFADDYIEAPDYDWTFPGPQTPDVEGGITGKVYRMQDGQVMPIAGARAVLMTLAGTMTYETNVTGVFSFDVAPGDYVLLVEADGFWGIAREIQVPDGGIHGFGWEMSIEDLDVKQLAVQLGLSLDTSKGIVSTWFTGAVGGETVHLSASSDLPITYDANDQPVLTNRLLPGGAPTLIFGDVELGRVDIEAMGSGDQSKCLADSSPVGNWLALPHVVSYVTVQCVNP